MSNTTTIITGASSGIGEGIARRLGAAGHRLVLAARRQAELERVGAEATRAGSPGVLIVPVDVTSRTDVETLGERAIAEFGGYDVWINNAGRGITRSVLDVSDDDFDQIMAVNVKSALYGMQIAARHFIERGHGQIINVSSFLGRVPLALHRSAYNAAKAALNSLTANLRTELANRSPNIHVTLVMPGMVNTDFARNALNAPPGTAGYSGPHVQTVEQLGDMIRDVIEHPVAELYTNPASRAMAQQYLEDPTVFDAPGSNPWAPRASAKS
jgi:NAD(P)-dependent dehydrogenase (short-subunit alcohol dehydrogenase family)